MKKLVGSRSRILTAVNLVSILAMLNSCNILFNSNNLKNANDGARGKLTITVPAIATWVATSLAEQSEERSRALAIADAYRIEIKDATDNDVIAPVDASTNSTAVSTTSVNVPEGSGYTVIVSVFNKSVSSTNPVVQGRTTGVNVAAGADTSINVSCIPVDPTAIVVDGGTVSASLEAIGERWYSVAITSGTTYYFTETSNKVSLGIFDKSGASLGSNGSYLEYSATYTGALYLTTIAIGGTSTAHLNVTTSQQTALALNTYSLSMLVGRGNRSLTASYIPGSAGTPSVSWSTSDGAIATVSGAGALTAVGSGSCLVTATDGGGKTASCAVLVGMPPLAPELLVNGDFSRGSDFWDFVNTSPAAMRADFASSACVVSGNARGTANNQVRLAYEGLPLVHNRIYELNFDASSSKAADFINVALLEGGADINGDGNVRTVWADKNFRLSTGTQTYSATMAISDTYDDPNAVLVFHFGAISSGTITIDNVSLKDKGPATAAVAPEMINNGDFGAGESFWCSSLNIASGATAKAGFEGDQFTLPSTENSRGSLVGHWQLSTYNLRLTGSAVYNIGFDASSSVAGEVVRVAVGEGGVDVNGDGDSYSLWFTETKILGATSHRYTCTFIMPNGYNDLSGRLKLGLGNTFGTIAIDNVSMQQTGTFSPPAAPEMVYNGDFAYGSSFWLYGLTSASGATAQADFSNGEFVLPATQSARGSHASHCQLTSRNKNLTKNGIYQVSFDASSSVGTDSIQVLLAESGVDRNGDGNLYTNWGGNTLALGTTTRTYRYTWCMPSAYDDPTGKLGFMVGNSSGTIVIDNVSLKYLGTFTPPAEPEMVYNGDFSNFDAFWEYWNDPTSGATALCDFSDGRFTLPVTEAARGDGTWALRLTSRNKNLSRGTVYRVIFDASSTIDTDLVKIAIREYGVDRNGDGLINTSWDTQDFILSVTPSTYTSYLTMSPDYDDSTGRFHFDMGATSGAIIIDNVSMKPVGSISSADALKLVGTWKKTEGANTGTKVFNADGSFDFYYNTGSGANERKKGNWAVLSDGGLLLQTMELWDGSAYQKVTNDAETIPWHVEDTYGYLGALRITTTTLINAVAPAVRSSGTSGQFVGTYTMDWIGTDGSVGKYVRTIDADNTLGQVQTIDGSEKAAFTWNGTWSEIDASAISVTKAGSGSPTHKWFLVGNDHLVIAALSANPGITSPTELAFQKQ